MKTNNLLMFILFFYGITQANIDTYCVRTSACRKMCCICTNNLSWWSCGKRQITHSNFNNISTYSDIFQVLFEFIYNRLMFDSWCESKQCHWIEESQSKFISALNSNSMDRKYEEGKLRLKMRDVFRYCFLFNFDTLACQNEPLTRCP